MWKTISIKIYKSLNGNYECVGARLYTVGFLNLSLYPIETDNGKNKRVPRRDFCCTEKKTSHNGISHEPTNLYDNTIAIWKSMCNMCLEVGEKKFCLSFLVFTFRVPYILTIHLHTIYNTQRTTVISVPLSQKFKRNMKFLINVHECIAEIFIL